jgi:hypothetical protein
MIAKNLPNGWFGRAVLEKAIRSTGITSRQSADSHVGDMLLAGWIVQPLAEDKQRPGKFRLSDRAMETGEIRIHVDPAIRIPEVQVLIEKALAGIDYVTIEKV